MTVPITKGRGGTRVPGPGKKLGRPSSPGSKKAFPVKLPPDVIKWLRDRKAADPRFSMGGWIGEALRAAIVAAGEKAKSNYIRQGEDCDFRTESSKCAGTDEG